MAIPYLLRPHHDSDCTTVDGDMNGIDPYPDPSDDDGTSSDTSEDIVELTADEIPGYFQERGGRLFHSHGGCPYPLPVDAEEQQRQNGLHGLLRRLIGDSSVEPVRELLTFAPGEQRRVLDLGTGTGQWLLDMARDFPHARFYGVDIVPIATRYPPRNVLFEMHDIQTAFRYDTGSIDVVHARSISMAIRNYGALLPEIARLLRHGGLFISCEWGRFPAMADGSDVLVRAPRACAFFSAIRETLRERRGIPSVAPFVPRMLEQSGYFTTVVTRRYHMPIGDWSDDSELQELGREYREMAQLYARSMRTLLLEGRYGAQADALIEGYISDTWSIPGLVSIMHTVHAYRA